MYINFMGANNAEQDCRRKLESKIQQNNVREVWASMKEITGFKGRVRQPGGSLERAWERFSSQPSSVSSPHHTFQTPPLPSPLYPLSPLVSCMEREPSTSKGSSTSDAMTPLPPLSVTTGQVRRQLERLHQCKASGPDGISPEAGGGPSTVEDVVPGTSS